MRAPKLPALLTRPVLRRPAVLAAASTLALAGLLAGGLAVAAAVDGSPETTQVDATAEATPAADSGTVTSGGDDNVAVANNTRDGSTVYAIRLKVVILNADVDVVDSGNAAVAAASCSDCQTVAIALEGVVVTGDAEQVSPQNIALAINSECSNCQTLAYAYQNLQTVDGKVRMTGEGRRRVAELRRQLNALRTSGLDVFAVKAEVDRIVGEFAEVLRTQIVPIAQPASSGSPAPSPSATASPDSSPSAPASSPATASTPSPEATSEPSSAAPASPSAEPSASPTS